MKYTYAGRFPSLNEYTAACRTSPNRGAKMKREQEDSFLFHLIVTRQKKEYTGGYPARVSFCWHEKDRRRDIDNISFAAKFVLDALVKAELLADDDQKHITEISHEIFCDAENPRVEITIEPAASISA